MTAQLSMRTFPPDVAHVNVVGVATASVGVKSNRGVVGQMNDWELFHLNLKRWAVSPYVSEQVPFLLLESLRM